MVVVSGSVFVGLLTRHRFGTIEDVLSMVGRISVTSLLSALDSGRLTLTFHLVPGSGTTRMFSGVSASVRACLMAVFARGRLGRLLSSLCVSSAISVLRRLPTGLMGQVLTAIDTSSHDVVGRLLGCPRSDTKDVVAARCMSLHRRVAIKRTVTRVGGAKVRGRAVCAYCVARHEGLINVMDTGSLVAASSSIPVGSLVRARVVSICARTSRRRITRLFAGCSLLTLPIVSRSNHVINVIAFSSTVSIVMSRTARSVAGVTTVGPDRGACFRASIFRRTGGHVP